MIPNQGEKSQIRQTAMSPDICDIVQLADKPSLAEVSEGLDDPDDPENNWKKSPQIPNETGTQLSALKKLIAGPWAPVF